MARFNLPDIDFLDVDPEDFELIGVSKFESLAGVTLGETDPRRKVFQSVAFLCSLIANNINYTGKQNSLAYATDNFLEHKGIEKDVSRLEPVAAKTVMRFEVNNPEPFTIPKDVRFSIEDTFFTSTNSAVVEAGTQQVDIEAVCEEAGTIGNGYLPGQIVDMVDSVPWVSKAYNITTSAGGLDWEDDDAFAERIRESNERFSTAGPELAYNYFAKSASQRIIDVQTLNLTPGVVSIFPLMEDGELATDEEKQAILSVCSDKSVRPLTDRVQIMDPDLFMYDLNITYYLPSSAAGLQESSQTAVNNALQEYIIWQKSKLGRGIETSELYALLQQAGAKRITVSPNEYIALNKNQVAREGAVNLNFGGFIDD